MDAAQWKSIDDLYLSFFQAVKAPEWHGKNFNALRDSIKAGQINRIEVPYCLVLKHYSMVPDDLRETTRHFIDLILELAHEGVPIGTRIED